MTDINPRTRVRDLIIFGREVDWSSLPCGPGDDMLEVHDLKQETLQALCEQNFLELDDFDALVTDFMSRWSQHPISAIVQVDNKQIWVVGLHHMIAEGTLPVEMIIDFTMDFRYSEEFYVDECSIQCRE